MWDDVYTRLQPLADRLQRLEGVHARRHAIVDSLRRKG